MARSQVLVTVTGSDQPGITARLTGIIATSTASLLDIEQVVVHGQLTLALLLALDDDDGLLKDLLFAAKSLGVELDFAPVDPGDPGVPPDTQRFVVTVIGRSLGAREIHAVASTLAEPIVNGKRKAELLEVIAQAEGVLLDQTIAVGDGANDVPMLEKAGLGIAFRAKKTLRERADTSLSATGLDAILYLLGISAEELQDATARFGYSSRR